MNFSYDSSTPRNFFKIDMPSTSSNNIINNYGVKVDDAVLFRRMLQNKYREDLDSIIHQKKVDSRNNQNQNKEYLSKIQRMNDRYNLEKITQKELFKEYNTYNEKEAEEKKQKMKELKENQYKEYLEKLKSINVEKEITKKINQEKKEQLRYQVEKDLMEYRQKKFKEKQKEKKEFQDYIQDKIKNDVFYNSEKKYRSKLSKMNNKIYKNALLYNDYLNEGKNNDIYNIRDDLIFNQKVAEMKQKEKQEKMIQSINNIQLQKEKSNIQNMYEQELKEQKLLDQQNYKNFLDKQKIEQKNNNNNNNILKSSGEQLLMPSYRYSNVPKSLINYTLNRSTSVTQTLKNDDTPKKFYLGDSELKHNPITCPIEDVSPKKYIISQLYRQNQINRPKINLLNKLSYFSTDFENNNNFLKDLNNDVNNS